MFETKPNSQFTSKTTFSTIKFMKSVQFPYRRTIIFIEPLENKNLKFKNFSFLSRKSRRKEL